MFSEWLRLHRLNPETVSDCIASIEYDRFRFDLDISAVDQTAAYSNELTEEGDLSLEKAINAIICPAFSLALGIDVGTFDRCVQSVRWSADVGDGPPHTIDHGVDQPPEIRMSWRGSVSDLICLAHELAHAIQLQLSAGSFMPPVARETCAFLGELALIGWARANDTDLASKLSAVWREESRRYYGDDCELLRAALADPDAAYSYRMNYPLARASAIVLWRRGGDLRPLFAAGSDAMSLLPFAQIADLAGVPQNHLPPMPPSDAARSGIDGYRALGAMALLDIGCRKGESERPIGDYYASRLHHLQDRTAYVALDEVGRPVGYAIWRVAADGGAFTLLRQTAPFGDHLFLQRALARHLAQDRDVLALHPGSARQEQVAW